MKRCTKQLSAVVAATVALAVSALTSRPAESPYWLEAMKKVNAGFGGTPRYVAQFGDSITCSDGFWKPVGWMNVGDFLKDDDGVPSDC